MAPYDPINTLAQWRIWQIELDVISTIGAGIAMAAVFVVAMLFGSDAAAVAYGAVFVGCGLVIVGAFARAADPSWTTNCSIKRSGIG